MNGTLSANNDLDSVENNSNGYRHKNSTCENGCSCVESEKDDTNTVDKDSINTKRKWIETFIKQTAWMIRISLVKARHNIKKNQVLYKSLIITFAATAIAARFTRIKYVSSGVSPKKDHKVRLRQQNYGKSSDSGSAVTEKSSATNKNQSHTIGQKQTNNEPIRKLQPPTHVGNFQREEYRKAVTVPVSLLLAAVRNVALEKVLLGSNGVIYFRTKNDNANNISNNNNANSRHSGSSIPSLWKKTQLPIDNAATLQREILHTLSNQNAVDVSVVPESVVITRILQSILSCIPFLYLFFVYRLLRTTIGGMNEDLFSTSKIFMPDKNSKYFMQYIYNCFFKNNTNQTREGKVSFEDVAGIDDTVLEVQEVVEYLKDPLRYHAMGATSPRGVLLYGPPGSGKTLLARAVANEADVDCFMHCSASDFVEVYVGRGAARVRSIFATARAQAIAAAQRRRKKWPAEPFQVLSQFLGLSPSNEIETSNNEYHRSSGNKPISAIIFIDELDALAKTRSGGHVGGNSSDEREQTLNQLLTEMDGFQSKTTLRTGKSCPVTSATTYTGSIGATSDDVYSSNDFGDGDNFHVTIIVIAASNRADTLDPAVLRRFDRKIFVGYPDKEGRKAILKVHARRIPLEITTRKRDGAKNREMTNTSEVTYHKGDKSNNDNENNGITSSCIQWDTLASDECTGTFSGSDLSNMINEAALLAVRERTMFVKQSHLEHAARRIRQMKTMVLNSNNQSTRLRNETVFLFNALE